MTDPRPLPPPDPRQATLGGYDPDPVVLDDEVADLLDPEVRGHAEALLLRLPGVELARIVPGDRRPVEQLHLLVQPDASPKMIVRDVETLLFTRFGVAIDRRVVSIAQLDPVAVAATVTGRGRPSLEGVIVASRRSGTTVTVELRTEDGELLQGTADGGEAHLRTAVATATLRAAEAELAPARAALQHVTVTRVGDVDTVIVAVELQQHRASTVLVGAAPLRDGVAQATARAALDAVNRAMQRATANV